MGEVPEGAADGPWQPASARFRLTRRSMLGLLAAGATGLSACGAADDEYGGTTPSGTPAQRRQVATDAYAFGYPLVLIDKIRRQALDYTTVNRFQHTTRLPAASQRTVVRVDLDNLYSVAWLDLREEPVLFEVPEITDRYWVMQILDAWSNTAHTPTTLHPRVSPDTAPPFIYAVTGPGWAGDLPSGVVELPVPTAEAWLYGRIEVRGAADEPAVHEIQSRLRLAPLSAWTTSAAAEFDTVPENQDWSESAGVENIEQMPARDFFERVCELMVDNPPAPEDAPAMRRFATIGIRPGGAPEGVSTGELAAGADQAKRQMGAYVHPGSVMRDGWVMGTDVGRYGTDYLLRAATASKGIGANLAEVALYPVLFARADEDGVPLGFTLRFAPGQAPPVEAFWSLTAYDAAGYLVQNPANLQTVGHPIPPEYSADGSLEFAIQAADPGPAVPRPNWLPIPEQGQFSLVMRLYEPDQRIIDGRWLPPPLMP